MTTALITGASGGIGLEIARVLAADHDVVLVARNAGKLDTLATELGGATRVIAADLVDPGAIAKIVAEVPHVDVLVNNAGVGDFGAFAEADVDKTLAMVDSLYYLAAIDALIGAQAVDLREPSPRESLGRGAGRLYVALRAQVPMLDTDRALGVDIEAAALVLRELSGD